MATQKCLFLVAMRLLSGLAGIINDPALVNLARVISFETYVCLEADAYDGIMSSTNDFSLIWMAGMLFVILQLRLETCISFGFPARVSFISY